MISPITGVCKTADLQFVMAAHGKQLVSVSSTGTVSFDWPAIEAAAEKINEGGAMARILIAAYDLGMSDAS
jgi:hypothetical protein